MLSKNAGLVLLALLYLASGPGLAQSGDEQPTMSLACNVAGYDVVVRNEGQEPVAAGIALEWSVPFARRSGSHRLDAPLEPGGQVFLSAALGNNYLDSSKPCELMIVQ